MSNSKKPGVLVLMFLFFLPLLPSCGGSSTAITSQFYLISSNGTGNETITNVPDRTGKTLFLSRIAKGDDNQSWDISDISDPVESGDVLVVTASDGATETSYAITVTEYSIGDTGPTDGIIIHKDSSLVNGWKYIEGAPSNCENFWYWSSVADQAIASTGTAIGTGQSNVTAIINQAGHSNSAARICDEVVINQEDDWFLPSSGELEKMYIARNYFTETKSISNGIYWSSSEDSATTAMGIDFSNGNSETPTKDTLKSIRCVRVF